MTTKKFSPSLHNKYDNFGREIVKKFVKDTWNLEAKDNPDQYGIDLVIYKEERKVGYAEVEVRTNWKGLEFPFDELNVPERKGKLFNNDLPSLFFSVNEPGNALMFCSDSIILSSRTENSPNKYLDNERFYKIPIKKMKYAKL